MGPTTTLMSSGERGRSSEVEEVEDGAMEKDSFMKGGGKKEDVEGKDGRPTDEP